MSVKSIFKILIGTIIFIITSCLVIELFNVFIVTNQLRFMQKVSARQACVLFTQETFKREDTEIAIDDIKASTGEVLITSDFYGPDGDITTEEIYKDLYLDSASGKPRIDKYVDTIKAQKNDGELPWSSMRSWYAAVNSEGTDEIGELYKENCVTPCNMGATYFDVDVLNRMYRWSLATTLGNSGSVDEVDNNSNYGFSMNAGRRFPYVDYRGFRIWFDDTTCIPDDIEYTLYNLNDETQREAFKALTSIDKYTEDSGLGIRTSDDERNYVVVASVPYSVSISYTGITPLRHIINFANNHRVDGFTAGDRKATSGPSDIEDIGREFLTAEKQRISGSTANPSSSYLYGRLDNRVVYYILR